jgi:hypothetical protein
MSEHGRIGDLRRASAAPGRPPRGLAWAVAGLVVVLAAGVLVGMRLLGRGTPPPGVTLTDLRSVDQLRSLFDADAGTTRLVLVLSPT